ncbi:MAG: hypothetical protein A3E85_03015 [Gammaproteobacteria bacterium RIFCSPHIGHO2_12_FULL_45_12]|nr:MAG: hypothetical protein A3E85_03015 [Gammaproteobacteria bacterium RIFCSPHIGHO2_12_FULL_45_12]
MKKNNNPINMFRMNHATSLKLAKQTVPLKTACLPELNITSLPKHWKLEQLLATFNRLCQQAIPTHRPAHVTLRNQTGSPLQAITPTGKTNLFRVASHGTMHYFTNDPQEFLPSSQPKHTELPQNANKHQAVKPTETISKRQNIRITRALLANTTKENKANNHQRVRSQNAVMASAPKYIKESSAKLHASSTGLFTPNKRFEWLHLIAHRFLGAASQNENNLVAGAAEANTAMMAIEAQIQKLSRTHKWQHTLPTPLKRQTLRLT